MVYNQTVPQGKWVPSARYREFFKNTTFPEPHNLFSDTTLTARMEAYHNSDLSGKALISWKYQQYMRNYLATVLSIDRDIGSMLNHLKETGEFENTRIIYTVKQTP